MGAVTSIGNNSFREISRQLVTDPDRGPVLEIIYEGTEAECEGSAFTYTQKNGAKCRTFQVNGPVWRLSALYGETGDAVELPVDKWERVTEFATFDIRQNPNFIQLAGTLEVLAQWVAAAKKILADPVPDFTLRAGEDPNALHILNFMAMGGQAYEVKRFVLRRRRSFSINYATQAVCNAVEKVYTTAALVELWGVPTVVSARLPADPPFTPEDCAWSWKERADNSEYIPAYGKVEEVKEWVFAAWNIYAYDLIVPGP